MGSIANKFLGSAHAVTNNINGIAIFKTPPAIF